jgi:hypothetical protein
MDKDKNEQTSSDIYPWFGTSLEDSAVEDEDEQKPEPVRRARQYSLSKLVVGVNNYGVSSGSNYNPCDDDDADDIEEVWTSDDDSAFKEEIWPSSVCIFLFSSTRSNF